MVLWTGARPSGRGLPPLDGGNGPVLCPEPPSCAPNPRHDPRTRVQASRAERGVGVIGDAAPSASAWSPPRGASCTGGCLQHRGVRWERSRRCSAQPAVRGAAAGAPRTRRDRRPDHRPQRQQTPEPTENVLHASSCAERRGAGGAVESTWRPSEASPDRLEHPVAGCSRRLGHAFNGLGKLSTDCARSRWTTERSQQRARRRVHRLPCPRGHARVANATLLSIRTEAHAQQIDKLYFSHRFIA